MSYTIGEYVGLPSKGKIYDKPVAEEILLRSMTGEEEMMRLTQSDKPYKVICDIIDRCMVNPCGISSYDMLIGDYQFLLYKLRSVTYGNEYKCVTRCPSCGAMCEETIDLDKLLIFPYHSKLSELLEFTLPKTGKQIKLKFQTPRLMDSILEETKEFRKRLGGNQNPLSIILTAKLIDTIDNEKPNPDKVIQMVRELPSADINIIQQHAEKFTESVGITNKIAHICDFCSNYYESQLKTDTEFFRPTIRFEW